MIFDNENLTVTGQLNGSGLGDIVLTRRLLQFNGLWLRYEGDEPVPAPVYVDNVRVNVVPEPASAWFAAVANLVAGFESARINRGLVR